MRVHGKESCLKRYKEAIVRSLYRVNDRFSTSDQVFRQGLSSITPHGYPPVICHQPDRKSPDQPDHVVSQEKNASHDFLEGHVGEAGMARAARRGMMTRERGHAR